MKRPKLTAFQSRRNYTAANRAIRQSEESLLKQLGVAVAARIARRAEPYEPYMRLMRGRAYRRDYLAIGRTCWREYRVKLYKILCVRSAKKPKSWLDEWVSGDIREFMVALISLLTSQYNLPWAIAVPLVALVVKMGLARFCRTDPTTA